MEKSDAALLVALLKESNEMIEQLYIINKNFYGIDCKSQDDFNDKSGIDDSR